MRLSRSLGLGAVTVTMVLLTACAKTESGTPTQAEESLASTDMTNSSTPTQNSPDDSLGPAPPVEEPLDPELVISKPCELLDEAQRDQLGLADGEPRVVDIVEENECVWKQSVDNQIRISAMTDNSNGLSEVYTAQEMALRGELGREPADYFEPITINGYPAVLTAYAETQHSTCSLFVGVTDRLAAMVMAQFSNSESSSPCSATEEAAEAMIETLKG